MVQKYLLLSRYKTKWLTFNVVMTLNVNHLVKNTDNQKLLLHFYRWLLVILYFTDHSRIPAELSTGNCNCSFKAVAFTGLKDTSLKLSFLIE